MARWLTVLIALVAQGMALMSPVCFVRCVGADGHECVELAGEGCQRCECQTNEPLPEVCAVSTCCNHCRADDDEQEAPVGPQITGQDCSCQHSPLEFAPQLQSKSLATAGLSQTLDFVTTLNFMAVIRTLENVSFSASGGLRPHASPHLAVVATVVMRV